MTGSFCVTKGGSSFRVEVALHQSAGTVDFIREMPNGRRGGAYLQRDASSAWRLHDNDYSADRADDE